MKEQETPKPEAIAMGSTDVVDILKLFASEGIEVYVDGGWGVDALLGEQTRIHGDLDIATPHKYVPKIRKLLEARGYKDIPRDDTREENFVLGDDSGHVIDIHSYIFDDNGKNVFGVAYKPEQLTGSGYIAGYPVMCISPEWMIRFHSGYELDEDDFHDVRLLCEKFNLPLPEEYNRFKHEK